MANWNSQSPMTKYAPTNPRSAKQRSGLTHPDEKGDQFISTDLGMQWKLKWYFFTPHQQHWQQLEPKAGR